MMKNIRFIFLFFFLYAVFISAQSPLGSFVIPHFKNIDEMMVDDYGNLYLQNQSHFNLIKIDTLGNELGRVQLTIPFKVQPIGNHLNIILFSEQAQEIKMYDQYFTEIQKINLQHLGYITAAYLQDSQNLWLIDTANRRIIQYNFRQERVINATTISADITGIKELLFFNNQFFVLRDDFFEVYDSRWNIIFSHPLDMPYRLRRENERILIFASQHIWIYEKGQLQMFRDVQKSTLVDKNNSRIFYLQNGQLITEIIPKSN